MTYRDYDSRRYWHLKELLHLRARTRVHGEDTTKAKRAIQRTMAKDRASHWESNR